MSRLASLATAVCWRELLWILAKLDMLEHENLMDER